MCQMVPTEQWLSDYTFLLTGRLDRDFIQVMRRIGNADVNLTGPDGDQVITDYEQIGEFEISTTQILVTESVDFRIQSDDEFGLIQTGDNWTTFDSDPAGSASYCHPGGIRIVDIFAP